MGNLTMWLWLCRCTVEYLGRYCTVRVPYHSTAVAHSGVGWGGTLSIPQG